MKIVIINKSDSTGGAAVVSRRLMEALRNEGADARMLVCEKLTDSSFVEVAAGKIARTIPFIAERLKIYAANGFDRATLFKIDTGSDGLPLWRHPLVKEADAILLNWVNQGMLSIRGIEKLLALGKPVIWTMHDMWCMTGICHHAGECVRYREECGNCPLLGKRGGEDDLSRCVWLRKSRIGREGNRPTYVAVSNWLARKGAESSLLRRADLRVIPNAFDLEAGGREREQSFHCGGTPAATQPSSIETTRPLGGGDGKIRILFGAARLDDPIKGLPLLRRATRILAEQFPEIAPRLELITFGGIKHPESLEGMALPHTHLGMINGEDKIREIYRQGEIAVSASEYETLPGTLVEAQAYGCIPVSFDRGGQVDIVDHLSTGYLARRTADDDASAYQLAQGIAWAAGKVGSPEEYSKLRQAMHENVRKRFSAKAVAQQYLKLIYDLQGQKQAGEQAGE